MTDPNKFTQNVGSGMEEEAEKINSAAREKIEAEQRRGEKAVDSVPKDVEDLLEDPQFQNAPQTTRKVKEKKKAQEQNKTKAPSKFEIDLDKYTEFVDRVTSDASKNFDDLMIRYGELNKSGCKIQRLDTAASGMVAEAGEFMEIVKKMKFQGKPYDQANKDHLAKELGDVMWYVAQGCLALGLRFDDVIYLNTIKLAARYPDGMFDVDYSEHRAPGDI